MKKLILFSLLVPIMVLTAIAQEQDAAWSEPLQNFRMVQTDTGYKEPGEFIQFLDRAEGKSVVVSFFGRFL